MYRRADGKTIVQSSVIQKIYTGATDWLPEQWHEALKIALASDTTTIETDRYFGGVVQNGDYQINWQDRFNRTTAPAEFKVEVSPFDASNSNCQTCEEATQISLVDDTYGTPVNDGNLIMINVTENDSICCFPVEFSIIYYNSEFISSASISDEGVAQFQFKNPIGSVNNLKIGTYRATCPNGGYDEADIYADVSGTVENCLSPSNLHQVESTGDSITMAWDNPSPAPADGYYWEVYANNAPGVLVASGTEAAFDTVAVATGLQLGTEYTFYLYSQCDVGVRSPANQLGFTTLGDYTGDCSLYEVIFSEPSDPGYSTTVTYYNCAGDLVSVPIFNGVGRTVCVKESSPGVPIYLEVGTSYVWEYHYIGTC